MTWDLEAGAATAGRDLKLPTTMWSISLKCCIFCAPRSRSKMCRLHIAFASHRAPDRQHADGASWQNPVSWRIGTSLASKASDDLACNAAGAEPWRQLESFPPGVAELATPLPDSAPCFAKIVG